MYPTATNVAVANAPMLVAGDMPVPPDELRYAMKREEVAVVAERCRGDQNWRRDSNRAFEYFDGNQFESSLAALLRARGIPMVPVNCIKRWMLSVIGLLEANKSDFLVRMDVDLSPAMEALAKALGKDLKEAERMTKTDRACLDAAFDMLVGGIGWLEVGDPVDAFAYPDRVEKINWREMFWDRAGQAPDLKKSKWFRRIRNYKREDLAIAWPDKAEIIQRCGTEDDMVNWWEIERLERDHWAIRDTSQWWNRRHDDSITISEIRYRVWCDGLAFNTRKGLRLFKPDNPMHVQAYQQGLITLTTVKHQRVRQAYWAGPHCLSDRWFTAPDNEIGWVPFICFQEAMTGAIYGLVRDMIPLQDEINSNRAKAIWAMNQKTVIRTEGAVLNADDVLNQINRKDGDIVLDAEAMAANGRFEIDRHEGDIANYMAMFNDGVQKIGYIIGLDAPFAGTPQQRDQSGVAFQEQNQQSVRCLSGPLSRYQEARTLGGKLLLDRRVSRMTMPQELPYEDAKGNSQRVAINTPPEDENGEMLTPTELDRTVVLDETPSTPTYRSQQLNQVKELMRGLTPEVASLLAPAALALTDLPGKQKYVDFLEQKIGMGTEPKTPEEARQREMEAQRAEEERQLAMRGAAAKVASDEAKAVQAAAAAEKSQADTQAVMQGMGKIVADIQLLMAKAEEALAKAAATRADTAAQQQAIAEGKLTEVTAQARW